jgi:hypothetical protein
MSLSFAAGAAATTEPILPREVRQDFDTYLQTRYREAGATTTPDHYRVLTELLAEAERGATVVDGQIHYIQREQGTAFYTNAGVMGQQTTAPRLTPTLRLALIGLAAVVVVGVLLLNSVVAGGGGAGGGTPTPGVTGTPEVTPTAIPVGMLRIGQAEVPPIFPVTLQIGARAWAVAAAPVDHAGGNWQVSQAANQANWLPGSVINWVFGLWDDPAGANAGVLHDMTAPTTATLRMSNGTARTFRLAPSRPISRLEISIFAQREPGLTIVLVGGPETAPAVVTQGTEITANPQGAAPPATVPAAPQP